MCLAQGHKAVTRVRLEPATPQQVLGQGNTNARIQEFLSGGGGGGGNASLFNTNISDNFVSG